MYLDACRLIMLPTNMLKLLACDETAVSGLIFLA